MFVLFGRLFVGAVLSVSLLSGCAGGAAPGIPSSSVDLAALSRAPSDVEDFGHRKNLAQLYGEDFGRWIYLAQLYGEDLSVYRRVGLTLHYVETLKQGVSSPQGTMATVNGWWYVANGGASNVLVYLSKKRGPQFQKDMTLNDPGQFPANVYATRSRRLVVVSNASTNSGGAGSVSVYLDRQKNPERTLTYGNDPLQGTGVAIDDQGNCYWAFNDPNTNNGSIVEFAGCRGSGTLIISGIANAQGITLDRQGNLYYIDQPSGIYHCKKTSNCQKFPTVFDLPINMNFDHKDKLLWVAGAGGDIYAVDPKTGAKVFTMQVGGPTNPPFGIAPAPGG